MIDIIKKYEGFSTYVDEVIEPRMVYIYKIVSPSGKIYIGQSVNIRVRKSKYKSLNCKGQPKLYNSLQKYGFENHTFEIIDECTESLPILYNMKETFWIEYYKSVDMGLNCNYGGDNRKHSDETKEKLRQANLCKRYSDEIKRKKSVSSKITWNKPEMKEMKRKLALKYIEMGILSKKGRPSAKKGIPLTDECKQKISNSLKKTFKNKKPHNFIEIESDKKDNIIYDYENGMLKYHIHKKYNISRRVVERIIKEYYNGSKYN